MNRMLAIYIFLVTTLLLTGCNINNENPLIYRDNNIKESLKEPLEYKVERVTLSKGYQNIDPSVEKIKKAFDFKVLVSLGLVESSGVEIVEINKSNNKIQIYVENKSVPKSDQLVIPQILIDLKGIKNKEIESLEFDIINKNYDVVKLKFNANNVIAKINSHFQLSTNTFPIVNILVEDNGKFWELKYNNIFDKYNLGTPIIDLSVIVDANNGEIVKSSKNFISSFIDEGFILDYISNKFILYRKPEIRENGEISRDNLWIYNIEDKTKQILYSSNSQIISATSNPNNNHIAIIECNGEVKDLYIVEIQDKKTYKVLLKDDINPKLVSWQDTENLLIVSSLNEKSKIYSHNILENKTKLVSNISKHIVNLQIMEDAFLFTEGNKDREKLQVFLSSNWNQFKFIDNGFRPKDLGNDKIAYLKFNEKDNTNMLSIYDLKRKRSYHDINLNITRYFPLDEENIGIVEKNNLNNDFTFHIYNIKNKKSTNLARVNSDNVFYDSERQLLYLDLAVPYESDKSQIIYSIDLSKISHQNPKE